MIFLQKADFFQKITKTKEKKERKILKDRNAHGERKKRFVYIFIGYSKTFILNRNKFYKAVQISFYR